MSFTHPGFKMSTLAAAAAAAPPVRSRRRRIICGQNQGPITLPTIIVHDGTILKVPWQEASGMWALRSPSSSESQQHEIGDPGDPGSSVLNCKGDQGKKTTRVTVNISKM